MLAIARSPFAAEARAGLAKHFPDIAPRYIEAEIEGLDAVRAAIEGLEDRADALLVDEAVEAQADEQWLPHDEAMKAAGL